MADELDTQDGPEGQDGKDPIAGLRAALEAERGKRQDAERRTQQLDTQIAELRGRVEGMTSTSQQQQKQTTELTGAQLRQAIDEGRMTEDEAAEVRRRQDARRIREEVTKEIRSELSSEKIATKVGDEIARYQTAVPELADRSSAQFAKAKAEFDYLVDLGHDPKDARTELLAARTAFGPLAALENVGTARRRETHQDTGGHADGEAGDGGGRKDGPPSDMPARNRDHYKRLIDQGVYSGWDQVKKEWGYKPKHRPAYAARGATA